MSKMNLILVLLRSTWSLWILVFLFSKGQDVKAAQCFQSKMGWWRCSACGEGTRCIFCEWCLGYCYNKGNGNSNAKGNGRIKRSVQNVTNVTYGDVLVPYKKPFIELFEDLETLIENEEISNVQVVELYKKNVGLVLPGFVYMGIQG